MCALMVPETFILKVKEIEEIRGIQNITDDRWQLVSLFFFYFF
jgi:hypothetical protein